MKKNGFIATSILYSFFLVFLSLFVALIANYLHNRILISKINTSSKDTIYAINNTKLTDLSVGDHIKFTSDDNILNSDGTWIVAKIETSGTNKKYYFISDLTTQNVNINYKIAGSDKITKYHTLTVNFYETLRADGAYTNAIKYGGFDIHMVTSSFLNRIRSEITDPYIAAEIFNPGGNYLVYVDSAITGVAANGATITYPAGSYYEIKKYNFTSGTQMNLLKNYCGGTFNGSKAVYLSSNTFGYMNVQDEPIDRNSKYISFCYYASPIAYTHNAGDMIVDITESKSSDVLSSKLSNLYNFRLVAEKTLSTTSNNTYIAGGKGTYLDPFIFTNGVKQ